MNFSFTILTQSSSKQYLSEIVDSIEAEKIPNSEILILGLEGYTETYCQQKNRAADAAKYDNVVIMHDYIKLEPGWYQGFLEFGDEWDVAMTRVLNKDGGRFRDWCVWGDPEHGEPSIQVEPWCPNGITHLGGAYLANYEYNKTEWMYVSGAYFVAKKDFMLKNKFLDYLDWGQGEDVEWSLRVRDKWDYKLNLLSSVKLLKQKDIILTHLY